MEVELLGDGKLSENVRQSWSTSGLLLRRVSFIAIPMSDLALARAVLHESLLRLFQVQVLKHLKFHVSWILESLSKL